MNVFTHARGRLDGIESNVAATTLGLAAAASFIVSGDEAQESFDV